MAMVTWICTLIQQENSNQPGRPKISCNDGNGWFRVCKDMSVFTDGDYDWVGSVGGVTFMGL